VLRRYHKCYTAAQVGALRFCFLTTFYPPHNFGGDGIAIQRLARALSRLGHEITVVHDVDAYNLLRRGPLPPSGADEPGIETIELRSRVGPLSPLLTHQLGTPVVHGARIRRLLADRRFDVIVYHNVSLVGGPGILGYGDAVKLYMAHEHWLICPMHMLWSHRRELCTGKECLRCSIRHRRPPQLYRWSGFMESQLRHVHAFIAMSEFSRDKHKEFGFEPQMNVVPYFLADPEPRSATTSISPHRRPYFLFVGRLEKIKGLDEVVPLFRDYPDADLLVAGTGDHEPELRSLARDIDRIRFVGAMSPNDLRAYYQHALAVIVPSICFETFGIVLIEAFQNRAPVIARRLGPFPELVETSGGGELFDTAGELVSAMRRIQGDPGYRTKLADAGHRAYLEHYCESAVVPRFLDVVRGAALAAGRPQVAATLSRADQAARAR